MSNIKPGRMRTADELIRGLREMQGLARAGLLMTARDVEILGQAADWIESADERLSIILADMEEDSRETSGLIEED